MKLAKTLLFPYMKRFWPMLLSVVLVGAFGCGILIGLRDAFHSLNQNIDSLVSECGYPDLYVQMIDGVDESYLSFLPKDFNDYMGIQKAEYRSTVTTTFSLKSESYSCRLIGYTEDSLLTHHPVQGELGSDSVRIDYYFAKANGIAVGDIVQAKMPDGIVIDFKIGATVVSPETSIVKADPYAIASSKDFAYVYIPKSIISRHSPKKVFNEMLIDFQEGKAKSFDQIITLLKAYIHEKSGTEITDEQIRQLKNNIAYATTYNDSEVITFYNDAKRALNLITIGAPAVFFLVVMIVTALFLFQIVKQCRKDIGVLRALGEKTSSISLVFLSLGFVVGFLSWVLGIGLGSVFTLVANEAYGTALKLFPQPFILHPSAVFISLGIIIFVTVSTSFLASLNIAKIKPVEAMKALPPSNNNTPYLTRTVFKNASIPMKVTISQTLRNARRYVLSGVCLLASGMLIFSALSISQSKTEMMTQLFSTRISFDAQVYFDNLPGQGEVDLLFPEEDSNITAKTLIKYLPSEMVNTRTGKKANALINGIKPDQELVRIVDDYQRVIPVPEHGIVLSSYHAYLLDAVVGDEIMANDFPLTVTAISNEFLYPVSYTSFDEYQPEHARGSLLVKVQNIDGFFRKYKDAAHVTYIASTNVVHAEFDERLMAFEISSRLLTAMAIVIGFMIVFNMMMTNLKEQKRTFATMRTLGFQRRSISMANLVLSLVQFLVAMALAIPSGMGITNILLKSISIPDQTYPFPRSWTMYVFSTLIVLAFLLVSHFLVMRTMKKWNLPESVKERE